MTTDNDPTMLSEKERAEWREQAMKDAHYARTPQQRDEALRITRLLDALDAADARVDAARAEEYVRLSTAEKYRARAEQANAERDALAATVERVRAVVDERKFYIPTEYAEDALVYADHVLAALDPAPTQPEEGGRADGWCGECGRKMPSASVVSGREKCRWGQRGLPACQSGVRGEHYWCEPCRAALDPAPTQPDEAPAELSVCYDEECQRPGHHVWDPIDGCPTQPEEGECCCVGYTIRTDYGTGVECDVDRSGCPVHDVPEEGER